MPIDRDGIIYVENPKKIKKKKVNIKNVCLIITTCISLLGFIISLSQNKLQKLDYETRIKELDLEKNKYENMLKESEIKLRHSYVLCNGIAVENLCLGIEDFNTKVYYNEIMNLFYDSKTNTYYEENDFPILDDELVEDRYSCNSIQVVFLRIDIVSNRLIDDLTVQCSKITSERNFNICLTDFETFTSENDIKKESKESVSIDVGTAYPSDMILIPLAVKYDLYDNSAKKISNEMTYKIVYEPKSISYYDEFNNETVTKDVRDMYHNAFISEYNYFDLG